MRRTYPTSLFELRVVFFALIDSDLLCAREADQLAPLFRVLETIPERSYYLLAIAIDDSMRGQGIGSVLMDYVEERARERGADQLCLDVAAKNEDARRLYERRGMSIESRWPKRLLPPLLWRMTKKL